MSKYICDKCEKSFSNLAHFNRHITGKHSCVKMNICATCNKYFKHKSSMCRHIKKCGAIIKTSSSPITNTVVNNNNNNTTNNLLNIAKVNIVKFGSENISHISDDMYKKILGRGVRAIEEFIECSHFDKTHPENHNIYITNIRNTYLVLYDGDKWIITQRDEKLEDIIYAKSDFLCRKFKELSNSMNPNDVFKFKKFMEIKDDQATIDLIKHELVLKFYNNRHVPAELRKQIDIENKIYMKKRASIIADTSLHNIDNLMCLLKNIPPGKMETIEEAIKNICISS